MSSKQLRLRCPVCYAALPPRKRKRLNKRFRGPRGLTAHLERVHSGSEMGHGEALVAAVAAEVARVEALGPADRAKHGGRTGPVLAAWQVAAKGGDVEALVELIEAGSFHPLTSLDKHGYTALCWAAGSNHTACVELLCSLDWGSSCTSDTEGVPPRQTGVCVEGSACEAWSRRLGRPRKSASRSLAAMVRAQGQDGRSPLHWAARNGAVDVVEWVMELAERCGCIGASPGGKREEGCRGTCTCGYPCGCDASAPVVQRLWAASAVSHVCKRVVDVRTSCDGTTPLQLACYGGHKRLAALLLSRGANPLHRNDYHCSLAHWACMGRASTCVDVVTWLVDTGIAVLEPLTGTAGKGGGGHVEGGSAASSPSGGGGSAASSPSGGGGSAASSPSGGGGSAASSPSGGGGSAASSPSGGGGSAASNPSGGGGSAASNPSGGGGSAASSSREGQSDGGSIPCGELVRFDRQQKGGVTALQKAAVKGAAETVAYLVRQLPRSALLVTDKSGYTAAELARCAGHAEVAAALDSAVAE